MAGNVYELRPKTGGDTEKITINLGYVDLGHIDLLVQDGFYSNRTDFIRTAIRNQIERHADAAKQSVARKNLDLGLRHYSREDLEAARTAGQMLDIRVLGLATIAADVSPELARATITSISVLGALQASAAVKAALADRNRGPDLAARLHRRQSQPGCGSGLLARRPACTRALKVPDMNAARPPDMIEATRLTRAGRLNEAAALLQRLFRGEEAPDAAPAKAPSRGAADPQAGRRPRIIDVEPETGEPVDPEPSSPKPAPRAAGAGAWQPAGGMGGPAMPQMPEALRGVLDQLNQGGMEPGLAGLARPSPAQAPDPAPDGARFLAMSFASEAGTRAYKLYIPSTYRGEPAPLVVMLHGCTQSPDDFAAGTRMNALAEEHPLLVAYPAQPSSANAQKCWNWFSPGDQRRGQGEPALIAGITRQVMRDHAIDPRRVYVAGLSAGGAAAAIMGLAYPDLYAAAGVHSGLACGAARDMPSAFAAMRQGAAGAPLTGAGQRVVPTIVFHADRDTTVHPRNGDQVISQSGAAAAAGLRTEVQQGQVPGGHAYSRTLHSDGDGQAVLEQWLIHGGGHAWSGGSPAGSYTDPRGPDASREMLRFFLDHPQGAGAR